MPRWTVAIAAALVGGCHGGEPRSANGQPQCEVVSQDTLPSGDPRTRELSGVSWDERARTLWAVSDDGPRIVALRPEDDLDDWSVTATISVSASGGWDGEGLVALPDRFLVADERGPVIHVFARDGTRRATIALPAHFGRAVRNASLESLSMTDDGRYLFTANESALDGDGDAATTKRGTMVRILRIAMATGERRESAYRTEPVLGGGAGNMGVAELTALSADEVLVLERSFVAGIGNSIRIFDADLRGAPDVLERDRLSDAIPVPKRLVADLDISRLEVAEAGDVTKAALHPNYEGMTLGPRLSDGRRTLLLVSDDNGDPDRAARVLVLALPRQLAR